jgi:hypothetical protein
MPVQVLRSEDGQYIVDYDWFADDESRGKFPEPKTWLGAQLMEWVSWARFWIGRVV